MMDDYHLQKYFLLVEHFLGELYELGVYGKQPEDDV
jgi:hypothetical protein